jgi:hypothetical protein
MSLITVSRRQQKLWLPLDFSLIFMPIGLVFRAVPINGSGPQKLPAFLYISKAILKSCG